MALPYSRCHEECPQIEWKPTLCLHIAHSGRVSRVVNSSICMRGNFRHSATRCFYAIPLTALFIDTDIGLSGDAFIYRFMRNFDFPSAQAHVQTEQNVHSNMQHDKDQIMNAECEVCVLDLRSNSNSRLLIENKRRLRLDALTPPYDHWTKR